MTTKDTTEEDRATNTAENETQKLKKQLKDKESMLTKIISLSENLTGNLFVHLLSTILSFMFVLRSRIEQSKGQVGDRACGRARAQRGASEPGCRLRKSTQNESHADVQAGERGEAAGSAQQPSRAAADECDAAAGGVREEDGSGVEVEAQGRGGAASLQAQSSRRRLRHSEKHCRSHSIKAHCFVVLQGRHKASDTDEGISSDSECPTRVQTLLRQLQERDTQLARLEWQASHWQQKFQEEETLRMIASAEASHKPR